MNIETRIKWTLILSLVMSYKNIENAFTGRVGVPTFGIHYLLAFFACWIGMSIMHRAIVWLAFDSIRRQIEQSMVKPRRRRSDRPPAAPPQVMAGEPSPPQPIEELPPAEEPAQTIQ